MIRPMNFNCVDQVLPYRGYRHGRPLWSGKIRDEESWVVEGGHGRSFQLEGPEGEGEHVLREVL